MGGFHVFQQLFTHIDKLTATFVSDISSNIITAALPVVTAGLTLSFIFYGLLVARGAVDQSLMDFFFRSFQIGIIVSIASLGGIYQSQIAQAIQQVPNEFATAILPHKAKAATAQGQAAANLIDQAAQEGFTKVSEIFHKTSILHPGASIALGFVGSFCLVSTVVITAVGGAFILLAKIALALLAGLGPLFILAMLFKSTMRFFEAWCAQVLSYGLLIVIVSAVFGLMMSMFTSYMNSMVVDETQNLYWNVGGCGIMCLAFLIILIQLPGIASGLSSGVGLGLWHEARTAKSMGKNSAAAARGARKAVGAIARGAASVGRAMSGGVGKAVGKFRGSGRAA